MGLPQELEYDTDRCGDALAVALGPCHPAGTSEVPTSSFKGWSCPECEEVFENGDLLAEALPRGLMTQGWGALEPLGQSVLGEEQHPIPFPSWVKAEPAVVEYLPSIPESRVCA